MNENELRCCKRFWCPIFKHPINKRTTLPMILWLQFQLNIVRVRVYSQIFPSISIAVIAWVRCNCWKRSRKDIFECQETLQQPAAMFNELYTFYRPSFLKFMNNSAYHFLFFCLKFKKHISHNHHAIYFHNKFW